MNQLNLPILKAEFFDRDAQTVAKDLLGKVIFHRQDNLWLSARIIETEAYYLHDKASHASLGYTEKRKALFMPAGTIYMYYARGKDSLNVSCQGDGNAVLIKSGRVYEADADQEAMLAAMQRNHALGSQGKPRPVTRLCSGQTLLCRALGLKVRQWDQGQFCQESFYLADVKYQPKSIIQTMRLGIPLGRGEHLPYRFIDHAYVGQCSQNPLNKRGWQEDLHYKIFSSS